MWNSISIVFLFRKPWAWLPNVKEKTFHNGHRKSTTNALCRAKQYKSTGKVVNKGRKWLLRSARPVSSRRDFGHWRLRESEPRRSYPPCTPGQQDNWDKCGFLSSRVTSAMAQWILSRSTRNQENVYYNTIRGIIHSAKIQEQLGNVLFMSYFLLNCGQKSYKECSHYICM